MTDPERPEPSGLEALVLKCGGYTRVPEEAWHGHEAAHAEWRGRRPVIDPTYEPANGECSCNHDAADLHREIAAGPVQAFRKHKDTGETVLVCLTCGGLWNHKATDRLIERICAASKSADDPTSAGVQR